MRLGNHSPFSSASLFEALGYNKGFAEGLATAHGTALARASAAFGDFADAVNADFVRSVIPGAAGYSPVLSPAQQPRLFPTTYAAAKSYAFAAAAYGANNAMRSIRGWSGAKLQRLFARDPFLRQRVEMALGGRILPSFGPAARIQLEAMLPGAMAAAANGATVAALQSLAGMSRAAGALGLSTPGQSSAHAMQSLLQHAMASRFGGGAGPVGGGTAHYQNGGHDSIQAIWNDPSLTVEDKTVLMLMMIMKKMDKEIEKQSKYIEQIQSKSKKSGKGGKGGKGGLFGGGKGKGGGGGGKNSPSVDVETIKLKRLIDKRGQMFDMLRQIIDKYNETAKNVIQSIGR